MNKYPDIPHAPVKLHLGCGERRLGGFIHHDIRGHNGLDFVSRADDLVMYDDNSVDLIYASHLLEHIQRRKQFDVLHHWRAKLNPGGILRLSVPDFDILAYLYRDVGVSFWRIVGPLYGRQNYEGNTHYCGFDEEYLAWLLTEAGFYDIRKWNPEEVLPTGYDDYSLAKIDGQYISLNLEATA